MKGETVAQVKKWVGIRHINQILALSFEGQTAKAKIKINTPRLGVKVYDIVVDGVVVYDELYLTDDTEYYMDKEEFLMLIDHIKMNKEL